MSLILRNSLLKRYRIGAIYRLLSFNYCAATSQDVQVKRTRASRRLVHPEIAPDNRVMLIQRRGSKALCPRFRDCILVPQFFDLTEATFCDRHNPFDVLRLLALDPRLQLRHELLRRKISGLSSRYFHPRFHFFDDLLPHRFHDGGILLPVLAGKPF